VNAKLSSHQLTLPERFRLVVAAMARDDFSEASELRRTCPDGDLIELRSLMAAFQQAILAFAFLWVDAARSNDAASALVHARVVAERSFSLGVSTHASTIGRDQEEALHLLADDPVLGTLFHDDPSELIEMRRADLRSAFLGFVGFCSSVDLDPTLVLGTSPALAEDVVAAADVLSDDDLPLTGFAEEVERQLRRVWHRGGARERGKQGGSGGRPNDARGRRPTDQQGR